MISVRRPGSRFAKPRAAENCVGRLNLMLHEWDVDAPPYPLPCVTLTSRQALKIAEFVSEQYQHVNQLIVQTEFASSQLTAIAETIGGWTGVFLQGGPIWPTEHQPTMTLLEMAFDAIELGGHRKTQRRNTTSSKDHEVHQLIDFVCSLANVTMLSSSRIRECYTLTADRCGDVDATLGVCLNRDQRQYRPPETENASRGKVICFDLEFIHASRERRVCWQDGCTTCLEALMQCNMPVCLAVIFDQRHLPPTFEHVLEAGGNWAIITRRQLMGRIKRIAEHHGEVQLTRRRESDFGLITIGDAPVCEVLHEVYRM